MLRYLSSALLAVAAAAAHSVSAAIDFSPVIDDYTHAGFQYRKVTLKADHGVVTFVPPQGWTIRGGSDRLHLAPPEQDFVEGLILAGPLAGPQAFDDATVTALEQAVLKSAPPESQRIQLVSRGTPVLIPDSVSCNIVISYSILGQAFRRSYVFVKTADTELLFRFTAPESTFEALNHSFRRSINSWQGLEAKPAPATATNAAASPGAPQALAN